VVTVSSADDIAQPRSGGDPARPQRLDPGPLGISQRHTRPTIRRSERNGLGPHLHPRHVLQQTGGSQRSHSGADGPTYDQLYAEARRRNIRGRSSMNKAELKRKLGR
jgi:hypothetical protein